MLNNSSQAASVTTAVSARSVGQIDRHDFKGVRFLYNRRERQRTTPPWFTFEKKRLVEYGLI